MSWTEQHATTHSIATVDDERANVLNGVKATGLPVVEKEADTGAKPFKAIQLQPIKGVKTFEAEFGVKDEDLIFHVWPWGYHEAERNGTEPPKFRKDIKQLLTDSLGEVFGTNRISVSYDDDVGSWFIIAKGFSSNQFHRDLCIEAARSLHVAMGGEV